ncbi:hypothetical protein FB451DRAFT_1184945 [Mycena latifolia]|nr:hypothetical protein FB451DRAFT_1184945 [Mycena latifolia]
MCFLKRKRFWAHLFAVAAHRSGCPCSAVAAEVLNSKTFRLLCPHRISESAPQTAEMSSDILYPLDARPEKSSYEYRGAGAASAASRPCRRPPWGMPTYRCHGNVTFCDFQLSLRFAVIALSGSLPKSVSTTWGDG